MGKRKEHGKHGEKARALMADRSTTGHQSESRQKNGGDMNQGKIESDIEYLKRDVGEIKTDIKESRSEISKNFKTTFAAMIFAVLGLAGLMTKGFGWVRLKPVGRFQQTHFRQFEKVYQSFFKSLAYMITEVML